MFGILSNLIKKFHSVSIFSCVVRVTGDMTISFPANMITMLATNPSPPVLSFIVTGTSSLEQIFPNKALVER